MPDIDMNIQTRIHPAEESVCTSMEQVVFPEAARTKKGVWKYIIQGTDKSTENMKQGVLVEICKNADAPCMFDVENVIPNGFETRCVQKYIYRKLAALEPDGQGYPDDFELPSCCVCNYRTTGLRSAVPSTTANKCNQKS